MSTEPEHDTKNENAQVEERSDNSLLTVNGLAKHFSSGETLIDKAIRVATNTEAPNPIQAVDGVSFNIKKGESFVLVGESGCGKTTVAQTIFGLQSPTRGEVRFQTRDGDWVNLTDLSGESFRSLRDEMSFVYQDTQAALNPRRTVGQAIKRPLDIHEIDSESNRRSRVEDTLARVGLSPTLYGRYPHELSGGQLQRVGIARALVTNPSFVILDEPVSALDVSIQAQILTLLENLQDELNLTYLCIMHDLSVVEYIADRIGVMYLGKIVETGSNEAIFSQPSHPYTRALLSSAPDANYRDEITKIDLGGDVPSPQNPPSGCPFHTRCPVDIEDVCREVHPDLEPALSGEDGHVAACHLMHDELEMDEYSF